MSGWQPPQCIHGNIILGCPHDDCPTQTAYLDQQKAALRELDHRQRQDARDLVRSALGLPLDEYRCTECEGEL
ncbi:hypothetical protein KNU83_gp081 [Mycobacterium phage LilMoolah]|uniref:Uncharacterized protein n=3 Tax=Caudoviricetes TaxID=2731619 RepID=A0A649VHW9_9CAUD|nr:hypothetical protein I5H71_gp079 [Mycobacterium phage Nivrat]YP_010057647.1 hypothetical protein KHO61_gp007 [Mycobacterium phage Mangeria]YP_010105269.1 hypothetical protein KNU83_gp081 [Mycobacterium phage LilMoolah]AXQ64572.1 hypothetical protein SEA_NIVRAT_79 [Mycobacterium phage Nivrat]QGJ91695.1 hypothetical protein SEA_LILMOOLAH_81 [Mycobacterium phage LilMoolah]QHB47577.1 hypothetical protein SEA_MANGERIA_7 [Mycobacterium phage Mangeria]